MKLGDRLGGVVYDIQQYRSFKRAGVPLPDYGNPVRRKWIEYCSEFLGIIEAMDEKELQEQKSNPRIGDTCTHSSQDWEIHTKATFCRECSCYIDENQKPIERLVKPNPRIGRSNYFNSDEARMARMAARDAGYERCINIEHDRCGQRKTDCTECFPPEQASLTSSLANLNEPVMRGTICTCKDPVCNGDNIFPKGCYECGGIVLAPTKTKEYRSTDAWPTQVNTDVLETVPAKTCVCPGRRGQPGSHCLTCGGTCDGVQR